VRKRAIIAALVVVACSSKSSPPPAKDAAAVAIVAIDAARPAVVSTDAAAAAATDAAVAAAATGPIPAEARLLVTSIAKDWDTVATDLVLYRRDAAGAAWQQVRAWKGTLGKTGLAWGRGLHGNGPPADQQGPMKVEGDGKSPAGVFTLDAAYGYGATPPAGAALPYTQVDRSWRCVDDPDSKSYNRIVDTDQVAKDWKSAEDMRRKDALYTWVIDVGHNPAKLPGEGSCIFLHVWRGSTDATVGCTAMAQPDIEALLADLDPAKHPVLVQLPAVVHAAFADAWQLPR
jgi:L,D-peptidoglycan transpeptidase YkuD (ErfK/YbiS/YcfS/YnhG family)